FFIWLMILRKQIRQRKIAEKALQDSENRFHSLSDAAFEGIVITEKGNILDANSALGKMLGYPTSELVGMKKTDLVTPEERGEVKSKILSGSETPYESCCLRKDGSNFPIEIHTKMFSYQGRQVLVTAIRDITKQRKAEEEIRILRKILPICSFCKNIRNDEGYYEQIEAYIHKHSGVDFSHTICPSCMEQHYPEEYESVVLKKKG
ncbi:MAG: PAS domain S-box protein, partial [Candidatus Electrothrix sp. ATG2]|nr:PAS domain S-box protein [Candidatus Electrothrix sp. ATG2]